MNAEGKTPDWSDRGWLDFAERMLEGDETSSQVRLLKSAWLHGARTAIDQAQIIFRTNNAESSSAHSEPKA